MQMAPKNRHMAQESRKGSAEKRTFENAVHKLGDGSVDPCFYQPLRNKQNKTKQNNFQTRKI
jgi:hypothetical protein